MLIFNFNAWLVVTLQLSVYTYFEDFVRVLVRVWTHICCRNTSLLKDFSNMLLAMEVLLQGCYFTVESCNAIRFISRLLVWCDILRRDFNNNLLGHGTIREIKWIWFNFLVSFLIKHWRCITPPNTKKIYVVTRSWEIT